MKSPQDWQDTFFSRLASPRVLLELFDYLPGIYMYIKDTESRFVRANNVVCEVTGVKHETELMGKTDFDFFPPAVAAQYYDEDQRVVKSAEPLVNQLWLVPGWDGFPRWYICNKFPLFDKQDHVAGIAGIKRPYEDFGRGASKYGRLLNVVEYVTRNYGQEIEVADMAREGKLSVSQLQREFSRLFGITPVRYVREVRIGVARHLLKSTLQDIGQIGTHCGFSDQSHFSRQFKTTTGLTPTQYREKYSKTIG